MAGYASERGLLLERLNTPRTKRRAKTRGAGIAWVWVEDYGGMHPPLTRMPIEAKLDALADLAGLIRADRVHLAGITWSAAQ